MKRIIQSLAMILGLTTIVSAQGQWPSRTVTILVPYAAGTAPDTIARLLAEKLSARIGQPVVVDNRTGAGGLIGTEAAASANNDGYTLFLGSLDTQAIIGHLYKTRHDPGTAFAPISQLGKIFNIIAASPQLKIGSIKDLIATGKATGKSYTFATPGVGTNLHLLGELFKMRTGVNLAHVPYRAASAGYTDAMAGRIDLVIAGLPPLAPLLKDKRLIPLVTTAPERIATFPDMPTMAEIGLKDLTITGWFGLLAPAGTNPKTIDALAEHIKEITKIDSYRAKMQTLSIAPVSTTPAEFADIIKTESARMADIIAKANIKVK
ncbi:MAG: tripartite tricarboxylate transporter substrate binding protein [Rhodopseudomonas sp.]|nr:tripartite tricarboxylate transporter substrate binding protein [Rhodopseudomonas sp.]